MIRCRDVCKFYQQGENQITALAGVSLEITKGSFAAVMGPSGSGKSTLLHLIGGLDRPTSGELLVDGRLIGQMADDEITLFRRTKIGFVFQFYNLLPTLTALENVALPFVLDGKAKSEADQRANQSPQRRRIADVGIDRLRPDQALRQLHAAILVVRPPAPVTPVLRPDRMAGAQLETAADSRRFQHLRPAR